jgi:hypothetical protein
MQINAYTPYRLADVGTDENIYLSLTWPYDQKEPRIKLSFPGGPGYSEAEIWAMLGRNNLGAGMATNALERVIDEQMTSNLNVQVGQRTIDDPTTPQVESESTVGVGTYYREFFVQYQRGLSAQTSQEVSVEYRLGRRFLIRSQMIYNSRRKTTGNTKDAATDEYNVDFKYRFEF